MISAALAWLNPYKWLAIGALALTLALVIGGQHVRIGALKNRVSALQADLDGARRAAVQLDKDFRAAEARWKTKQKEDLDAHDAEVARLNADRAIADAAAGRLQQRVAALVAQARRAAADPGPAASRPPAGDAVDLLADLQRRLDETAGQLAAIADQRGAAGELCEKLYDSLTGVVP